MHALLQEPDWEQWNEVVTSKDDDSKTELLLTVSARIVDKKSPVESFDQFPNNNDTATRQLVFPDANCCRWVNAAFSVTLLSATPGQRRAVCVRAAS